MFMNITIPMWSIIIAIIVYLTPIIWAVITMYFTQDKTKIILTAITLQIENQQKLISFFDTKFELKHDTLEKDINYKIDKVKDTVQNKISEMNNNIIKTQTLVELLVSDKIKKP